MGHGSSDAVLDLLSVTSAGLDYRLGVTLRPATEPLPSSALTPDFRVQIAAPPPPRTDGSAWYEGLRVDDDTENGRPFDPDDSSWMSAAVFALQGISPLSRPDPKTLIFDEPVAVDRVTDASVDPSFTLIASDRRTPEKVISFLSIPYPLPRHPDTGREVQDVSAAFYRKGRFDFTRPVSGFAALSLDEFTPAERSSVEYIFFIP